MPSRGTDHRIPRLALVAVLIATFMTLAGCTLLALPTHATHKPVRTPAAHTPTPRKTATHYTIQYTSAGYVYDDGISGYAVTFPGKPEVAPLAINGTARLGNFAGYADKPIALFASRGEVRDSPPQLRSELFGWIQSAETSGQIGASSDELAGLPSLHAEFTMATGEAGETVVASEGNTLYQLIALGGTPEQRQAFFDSFKRTNG